MKSDLYSHSKIQDKKLVNGEFLEQFLLQNFSGIFRKDISFNSKVDIPETMFEGHNENLIAKEAIFILKTKLPNQK